LYRHVPPLELVVLSRLKHMKEIEQIVDMSVLNIVELQNVVTSASGVSPISYLSNQVANIGEMVDYEKKQINVNAISNFSISPIQLYSALNLCNVSLSYNGDIFAGSDAISTGSVSESLGTPSTGYLSLGFSTGTGLAFVQGSASTFVIGTDSNVTFSGTVTAAGFVTASDGRLKRNTYPITNYETILSAVDGVRFEWAETNKSDVGVVAQSLMEVLPEAVVKGSDGYYKVDYFKIIPVLIQSVKSLQERVSLLERGFNQFQQSL